MKTRSPYAPVLIAAALVALLSVFTAGLVRAQTSAPETPGSQTIVPEWQKAAGGHLEFDVSSVKQSNSAGVPRGGLPTSNVPLTPGDAYPPNGGLFQASHWPLIAYVTFAYKLRPDQLQGLSTALPSWALSDAFDIQARAQGAPSKDQMRLMMQSLLVDRFKLAVHTETHDRQIFGLVLDKPGKLGPQLKQHTGDLPACTQMTADSTLPISTSTVDGGFPSVCGSLMMMPPTKSISALGIGGREITMDMIASTISAAGGFIGGLSRPVQDKTGLTGTFDFLIQFSSQMPFGQKSPTDDAAPTFLEALKDQLGLKLDPQNGPVEDIVIDHIDHPSEN